MSCIILSQQEQNLKGWTGSLDWSELGSLSHPGSLLQQCHGKSGQLLPSIKQKPRVKKLKANASGVEVTEAQDAISRAKRSRETCLHCRASAQDQDLLRQNENKDRLCSASHFQIWLFWTYLKWITTNDLDNWWQDNLWFLLILALYCASVFSIWPCSFPGPPAMLSPDHDFCWVLCTEMSWWHSGGNICYYYWLCAFR